MMTAPIDFGELCGWLLGCLAEDEATGAHSADVEAKRSLVEWAQGIEYLREVEDPRAPVAPLGEEAVRIIAEGYAGREGWRPEWMLGLQPE